MTPMEQALSNAAKAEESRLQQARLDEAVRGPNGLIHVVAELKEEVSELSKFRNVIVGVTLATNTFAPLIWHFIFKTIP